MARHARRDASSEGSSYNWSRLAKDRLAEAWKGEDDALYDYL
ncbi:MAG TPA: hypothetical protein VGL15_12860 [Vicinamibacteria bacterium]